jgi:thioredoxin reductase (NADPH)
MIMTHQVENYPGLNKISGYDLMEKFNQQAKDLGVEFEFGEAQKIAKQKQEFEILLDNGKKFSGKAVLLAFGLSHRQLNAPGEKELSGKGVTYCATCDGPLYRNKTVAVIGGGNSALDAVLYLSGLAKKVYLINRTDKFRAESGMLKRARALHNVEVRANTQVAEIIGDKKVSGLAIYNSQQPEQKEELAVEGVFIEIGYEPRTAWLKDLIELSPAGEIIVDHGGNTSRPGILAAGDCTDAPFKQIVIAAGAGAQAALSAYKYLTS